MKMKIDNFSPYDWYQHNNGNYYKCSLDDFLAFDTENVSPVELKFYHFTDNGFDLVGDKFVLKVYSLFTIELKDGCYAMFECCGHSYKLTWVHELQHLIRLCGLDELANNFKVRESENNTLKTDKFL